MSSGDGGRSNSRSTDGPVAAVMLCLFQKRL